MKNWIPHLNAALEGRYRVERVLGAGGMASVFLAEDLRHRRHVALKVLDPELGAVIGPERFQREITIVATIDHPHIVPLLDSGQADGLLWYTMPYVEGETLAERLKGLGELSIEEAMKIGGEVAGALEGAHRRGIVHRDVTPANVMLADGHARLMDFGIAQAAMRGEGGPKLTRTGMSIGTPSYMSPEQVGGSAVDARSDIYSLGCVMFEMLAGRPPFTGRAESVLYQHVSAPVPNVQGLRPGVPGALARLLGRCLAKSPADRPQSAAGICEELTRIGRTDVGGERTRALPPPRHRWPVWAWSMAGLVLVGALLLALPRIRARLGSPIVQSVAVLPFVNLSGDPGQDYFADGMTEALIHDIARVGTLRVISRTSIMRYKNTRMPSSRIARELGVEALLEGSVLRVGPRIRITIQLVRRGTENAMWSQRYDRDFRDILALEADVAQDVAREVNQRLTPVQRSRLRQVRRMIPAAHEEYLKGRFYLNRQNEAGYRQALSHFDESVRLDPMHAGAWAGAAQTYYYMSNIYLDPDEAMPRAQSAAMRAIALDSTHAEAHAVLGVLRAQFDWDWRGAERAFRRSIELNSNDAVTHFFFGVMLVETGRLEESEFEFRRALELDPLSFYIATTWIRPDYMGRRYSELIPRLERLLRVDPNYSPTRVLIAMCRLQEGRYREAISMLEGSLKLADEPFALALLCYAYGRAGRRDEAIESLHRLSGAAESSYVSPYTVAWAHVGLGDHDSAFLWLERACEAHDENVCTIRMDPILDPLRSDLRYQDLVKRVRLAGTFPPKPVVPQDVPARGG